MASDQRANGFGHGWIDDHKAFALMGGISPLTQTVSQILKTQGYRYDPDAPIVIILDAPAGVAVQALTSLARARRCRIVVTWNPCPEYWEDLWDMRPDALLVDPKLDTRLAIAMLHVVKGVNYRDTPTAQTSLTPTERHIFRLLSHGYSTRQIAQQMALQDQTVRNTLTNIYEKLELSSRNVAPLYYWGNWHAFDSMSPA